jgi:pimeloyl-ACP methyl ester carboxylesterase
MPELLSMPNNSLDPSYEEHRGYFTSASEVLYGVLYLPKASLGTSRVVVFCHASGIEHMVTQRMQVLASRDAAGMGFPAFCYDSRGHGDSTGNLCDVTFADLVDDACAAADYAKGVSGATEIVWVGVRFGCLVAAAVIARRNDGAGLALWEPLHQASEYFRAAIRTKLFCEVARGRRSKATVDDCLKQLEATGVLPVIGTYLYAGLWASSRDADLNDLLSDWKGDTLIAQVQRRPALSTNNHNLSSAIEKRGGKVTVALIGQEPSWTMLPVVRPQWVSTELLTATMEWLHGLE